jgi:hypothetical protein
MSPKLKELKEPKDAKPPVDQMILATGEPLLPEPVQAAAEKKPESTTEPTSEERYKLPVYFPRDLAAKVAAHCVLEGTNRSSFVVSCVQREIGSMAISRRRPKASEPLKVA